MISLESLIKKFGDKNERILEIYYGNVDGEESLYLFTNCDNYFQFSSEMETLSRLLNRRFGRHFALIHLRYGYQILHKEDMQKKIYSRVNEG